jgi:hypothetical protein
MYIVAVPIRQHRLGTVSHASAALFSGEGHPERTEEAVWIAYPFSVQWWFLPTLYPGIEPWPPTFFTGITDVAFEFSRR